MRMTMMISLSFEHMEREGGGWMKLNLKRMKRNVSC